MADGTMLGMDDRAEWRKQAVTAAGVVGMWEWDHHRGTARYCTVAAGLLAGDQDLAWRELPGDRAFGGMHADDAAALCAQMGGDAPEAETREYQIRISTDGVRRVLCSGRSCRDADGNPIRSMGTVIDITGIEIGERSPLVKGQDELDAAAWHGMATYEAARATGLTHIAEAARALLMAIGQEIARRVRRGPRPLH